MTNIAVILAGGQGARMGGIDKGAIDLGGKRMIDRIYGRLKSQCGQVLISGSHDYDLGLEVIPDIEVGPQGPMGGLYAIWRHLKDANLEGFFTAPIDGPNLPSDLLARLYRAECSAIASDDNGLHPAFAWWRMGDLSRAWDALDLEGSISLNYLARQAQAKHAQWAGEAMFKNLNTPDDLENYRNRPS
jgi:molybdopterin-guanine dinucleotide biosynthesis protein A